MASIYPIYSDAAGVNPEQIPEAIAADKRLGVHCDYHPETGQAIFHSPGQVKKYLRAHKLIDKKSFG